MPWLDRGLPLLAIGLWGLFVLLGMRLIGAAPGIWMVERVAVALPPGGRWPWGGSPWGCRSMTVPLPPPTCG